MATTVVLALAVAWFWTSPVFQPIRLLVVLFHEVGHAATAVATGGRILEIGLGADEGGHALTEGGWRFAILNGGYLGSLVAGVLLLALSRSQRVARGLVALLGLGVAAVSLGFMRPILGFGFFYGLAAGACILALARWAPAFIAWGFLRILGLFSVFYAIWDIRDDIFTLRDKGPTDASMLADLTGVPAVLWGVAWVVVGGIVLGVLRRRIT